MDSKSKVIVIEEKEPIVFGNTEDQGSPQETQYRVISARKFILRKFSAKTSLKIVRLLAAKVLPVFDGVEKFLATGLNNLNVNAIQDNQGQNINIDSIAKALDMVSDADLDKLIDTALHHCFEILPSGEAQVLTNSDTYGVQNIDDDPIIVMRLTVEAIWFSVNGFFDGNRLGSILKPIADMFQSTASM